MVLLHHGWIRSVKLMFEVQYTAELGPISIASANIDTARMTEYAREGR